MSGIGIMNLIRALQQAMVPSSYQGVVGAGSTAGSVVDSVGGFAVNQWQNYGIQFTQDTATVALRGVWQQVTANSANALTLAVNLPAVPVAGDTFNIRSFGSAAQSIADGADVTQGAKADVAATDSTSAWSMIALLKGLWSLLASALVVGGNVAHDAVDSGNPVKIGGRASSGFPTPVVNGDRVDAAYNLRGAAHVTLRDGNGAEPTISSGVDATTGGTLRLYTYSVNALYNGTAFDGARANTDTTVLASAVRTATTPSPDQTLHNGRGVAVTIDVTAIVAAPSITVAIEVKDAPSGKYVMVLTSVAIVAVGTTRLRVCPGITVGANTAVADLMARTWRVTVAHANANSITYSVGAGSLL